MINATVTLIGPGGAGKSTIGAALAARLGTAFVDLDRRFEAQAGDIGEYISRFGYYAYTRQNIETYRALIAGSGPCVAALSSGFMTYSRHMHPEYARLRRAIERRRTTFVLIPSLHREVCVAEIVRRQATRPFARPPEREEAVIRERFAIYAGLRARKIETMRPVAAIVGELAAAVGGTSRTIAV